MLGLPSTTEVGRRLPKEAFYRNLKLTPKQKDTFVHGVERIEILNSIKESTIHIPAGDKIEEIMVVGIELRDEGAAETIVDEIAKVEPEVASCCVPECVYRGFCPEFKSCGYVDTPAYAEAVKRYRTVE